MYLLKDVDKVAKAKEEGEDSFKAALEKAHKNGFKVYADEGPLRRAVKTIFFWTPQMSMLTNGSDSESDSESDTSVPKSKSKSDSKLASLPPIDESIEDGDDEE